MGQKIHPLGFRVGITKTHQSQWFARFQKRNYAQTVLEDRLLRTTLLKMFPELLNPLLKKVQKRDNNPQIVPKITHIKIERGLIPYEIGIQIHAGNCELIKLAIDNLKVNNNLIHNLQKTRHYLLNLKTQVNGYNQTNNKLANFGSSSFVQNASEEKLKEKKIIKNESKFKTLKKRKRRQFRENLIQNIMILKKGKKITRKFQKKSKTRLNSKLNSSKSFQKMSKLSYFGQSPKSKKFVSVFSSKMSQQFSKNFQLQMSNWSNFMKTYKEKQIQQYGALRYAPLGYQSKWSLSRLNKLQKQPLDILGKLLKSFQKKAIQKFEILKKSFNILGSFSKAESFNYYQMIRFIKGLKQLIQQIKNEQRILLNQKNRRPAFDLSRQMQKNLEKSLLALTDKALMKKVNNIDDECRKTKLIDYLQHMVQKHRQKNIYLYLSTISDSRKYLHKLKKFTKQQAQFLFGVDLSSVNQLDKEKQVDFIRSKVTKAFKQSNRKNQLEKNFHDVFLDKLQQQRVICEENIKLNPKISIKFYSVKNQNLETKATLVADSIVDSLEKRQAFRKVIKQAKESLMANKKVKGVKIQVSGRLNGAEIARSEWIRAGRVPLQTLRANIDYCYKTASTIYGIIGVKVWIYKGYTKNRKLIKKSPNFFQIN
jgi:ribosomal protein S3